MHPAHISRQNCLSFFCNVSWVNRKTFLDFCLLWTNTDKLKIFFQTFLLLFRQFQAKSIFRPDRHFHHWKYHLQTFLSTGPSTKERCIAIEYFDMIQRKMFQGTFSYSWHSQFNKSFNSIGWEFCFAILIFTFFNGISIFTNPSARAGYDTRSIFKRSLTGLYSEFSFS